MKLRSLIGALTIAALTFANAKPAGACSEPHSVGAQEIERVQLQNQGTIARNGALLFAIRTGVDLRDLASIARRVRVDVTNGGQPVAGALRALDDVYFWNADGGGLPVGLLRVTVTYEPLPGTTPQVQAFDIAVDDRVLSATPPPIAVKATAYDVEDPSSPKIRCTAKAAGDTCSGSAGQTYDIATRRVLRPFVAVETSVLQPGDTGLLTYETDVFGRNKDGTTSARVKSTSHIFEQPWDEYCVHATTFVIGETTKAETTVCTPHALDLRVDETKAATIVKGLVKQCDTAVYPPGTSAEDPTGIESDDGCSTSGRSSTTPVAVLVALLGLALVRGRRARSR